MQGNYVVTSTGVKDGKSYSSLSRIVQGKKENGDTYAFIDSNNRIQEDEQLQLGSVVQYETKRMAVPSNIKINEAAK